MDSIEDFIREKLIESSKKIDEVLEKNFKASKISEERGKIKLLIELSEHLGFDIDYNSILCGQY